MRVLVTLALHVLTSRPLYSFSHGDSLPLHPCFLIALNQGHQCLPHPIWAYVSVCVDVCGDQRLVMGISINHSSTLLFKDY